MDVENKVENLVKMNDAYGWFEHGENLKKTKIPIDVNVDFVPFIRGVRVFCKPRPE